MVLFINNTEYIVKTVIVLPQIMLFLTEFFCH